MTKLILQIALLFAAVTAMAVEPYVDVTVEGKSLFVYEPFNLKVDVKSEVDPGRPAVPDGPGYAVSSVSAGVHHSYSQKNTTSFLISIVASQSGIITIAPVEVNIDGHTLRSSPLRLVVNEPQPAAGMQLTVSFSETNLYVDQAVEMDVDWKSSTPFVQYQELLFDIPVLRSKDFAVYALEPDVPEKQRIGLPVNEQRIIAERYQNRDGEGLRFRFILVPHVPGLFGSGKIRLACALMSDKQNSNQYPSYFNNNFFSIPDVSARFERVYLVASLPRIQVTALPESGRSAFYSGVAGFLNISTVVNPDKVVVGQPMMFEVNLTDMVYGGQVTGLPAAALANLGKSFKITSDPIRANVTASGHRFIYALRPLRCDVSYIPAIVLQIFDPQTAGYRIIRSKPVRITVEPDDGKTTYVPAEIGGDNLLTPLNGIRANTRQNGVLMSVYDVVSYIGEKAWVIWLIAPVVWFIIRRWIGHLERCRTDVSYARAAFAMRLFRKRLDDDVEMALRGYLSDRFGLYAGAITAESCVRELEKRGLAREIVLSARECFNSIDCRKYSPSGEGGINRDKVTELVKAIEGATKIFLLILLLAPAVVEAGSPDESFQRAMKIRAERPDEACPVFVEAALEYERRNEFFNAGNSWFFAGESGRALADYLAAESRTPFSGKIRESIVFLRAQRSEAFEQDSGSGVVRLWRCVCRWDWRLRAGVLTLLYLAAWYIYILYRVFGWTPGRRFCAAYGAFMGLIALTLLYSSFLPVRGVVVQSAGARLGPGYAYGPAYDSVLPPATEFDWLETKGGWVRIGLPDGIDAWLHESACVRVR